ncbi:MAG: hypothetical protein IVW54_16850 [Candidatus Binataceae bacterium]|nr:hypothetical protein [Candidatus Binataceae bacterium]
MSRGSEQNAIEDLKRNCKLVDVTAEYTAGGWRIRGRRKGQPDSAPVVDIRENYLKTAKKQFEEAYGKALSSGILKAE